MPLDLVGTNGILSAYIAYRLKICVSSGIYYRYLPTSPPIYRSDCLECQAIAKTQHLHLLCWFTPAARSANAVAQTNLRL